MEGGIVLCCVRDGGSDCVCCVLHYVYFCGMLIDAGILVQVAAVSL